MTPDALIPPNPTAMYLLAALTVGILALVVWMVKYVFGRFADGQDKIVVGLEKVTDAVTRGFENVKDHLLK